LKAGRKIFQERLAIQLAWFLEHFIKHEKTPMLSVDRNSGGFILMGWSFGNATMLSLFSDPDAISQTLYETVEPYMMSLILYGQPTSIFTCITLTSFRGRSAAFGLGLYIPRSRGFLLSIHRSRLPNARANL
jgi:hypothetical protein